MTRTRRIGPIGTTTRLIAAAALLYLALFNGASWGLRWYGAVLGLVDNQIGCPTFSPIDHAETRRLGRTNSHHDRARTSPVSES